MMIVFCESISEYFVPMMCTVVSHTSHLHQVYKIPFFSAKHPQLSIGPAHKLTCCDHAIRGTGKIR